MSPSQSLVLYFTLTLLLADISTSSSDYTNLVFKGCADQNFQDFDNVYKPTLTNLLDTLTTRSSSTKFYNTTSFSSISGLFQCRGDLSNDNCNKCVAKATSMSQKLCGQAVAVRVQLNGCYIRYEVSGFRQVSETEFLFKVCGRGSGAGIGDRLDTALEGVVKGVGSGSGFYAGGYESVYVLGQCQGDLSSVDCASCVKSAVERAKSECVSSNSAQVYLQECYISYTYYPNGVPRSQQSLASSSSSSASGTGRNTEKTVAIVLGGLVGVGLVMACLLYTKSAFKKKTHTYKYGG